MTPREPKESRMTDEEFLDFCSSGADDYGEAFSLFEQACIEARTSRAAEDQLRAEVARLKGSRPGWYPINDATDFCKECGHALLQLGRDGDIYEGACVCEAWADRKKAEAEVTRLTAELGRAREALREVQLDVQYAGANHVPHIDMVIGDPTLKKVHAALSPAAPDARTSRTPLPPDVLADAIQDSAHYESGPVRAAKSVRTSAPEPEGEP